jgi:hypothetical protein
MEDNALWHLIGTRKKKKKKFSTDFARFENYSAYDFTHHHYVIDICMMQKVGITQYYALVYGLCTWGGKSFGHLFLLGYLG